MRDRYGRHERHEACVLYFNPLAIGMRPCFGYPCRLESWITENNGNIDGVACVNRVHRTQPPCTNCLVAVKIA